MIIPLLAGDFKSFLPYTIKRTDYQSAFQQAIQIGKCLERAYLNTKDGLLSKSLMHSLYLSVSFIPIIAVILFPESLLLEPQRYTFINFVVICNEFWHV